MSKFTPAIFIHDTKEFIMIIDSISKNKITYAIINEIEYIPKRCKQLNKLLLFIYNNNNSVSEEKYIEFQLEKQNNKPFNIIKQWTGCKKSNTVSIWRKNQQTLLGPICSLDRSTNLYLTHNWHRIAEIINKKNNK
jgi:small nuclear ribonucleoprotein (snRNP)-like protein